MTTIKAYTDFSQSNVLAEILPLETADMKWYFWKSEIDAPKLPTFGYGKDAAENCKSSEAVYLPCWSLASLLNYLRMIDFFPDIEADEHSITMNVNYYNEEEARPLAPVHNIEAKANTFVDACYEIILRLHEHKIL